MKTTTLTISARFCGPPNSGNGGYVAGRVAAFLGDSAEVMLRSPPPLDVPMQLRPTANGVELWHGDRHVASGTVATATAAHMNVPSFADAAAAAERTFPAAHHKVPGCFVCGPGRLQGDGLRIHVGPVDAADREWQGVLAATWLPPAEFADETGLLRSEFVWAALDCPTAYACATARGMPPILLGRQTVSITRRPKAGERCVITAQRQRRDGRKHFANAELTGEDGASIAVCNAVWIEVSEAQLNANA